MPQLFCINALASPSPQTLNLTFPAFPPDTKKTLGLSVFLLKWRTEWDSNPRYPLGVHTISNRAPSASRSSVHCTALYNLFYIWQALFYLCEKNPGANSNRNRHLTFRIADNLIHNHKLIPIQSQFIFKLVFVNITSDNRIQPLTRCI